MKQFGVSSAVQGGGKRRSGIARSYALMCTKVVVRRVENNGAGDFKYRLPILVGFLDIAKFHRSDPLFRRRERSRKGGIEHQTCVAVRSGTVRSAGSTGCFACKQQCKRRSFLCCSTMIPISAPQFV